MNKERLINVLNGTLSDEVEMLIAEAGRASISHANVSVTIDKLGTVIDALVDIIEKLIERPIEVPPKNPIETPPTNPLETPPENPIEKPKKPKAKAKVKK